MSVLVLLIAVLSRCGELIHLPVAIVIKCMLHDILATSSTDCNAKYPTWATCEIVGYNNASISVVEPF